MRQKFQHIFMPFVNRGLNLAEQQNLYYVILYDYFILYGDIEKPPKLPLSGGT